MSARPRPFRPASLLPPMALPLMALTLLAGCLVLLTGCGVDRDLAGTATAWVELDGIPVEGRPGDGFFSDPALQALERAARVGDVEALLAGLDDPEPRVRARAAFSLASVDGSMVEGWMTEAGEGGVLSQALRGALHDPAPEVRRDAAFALGRLSTRLPGNGADLTGARPVPETHSDVPLEGRHLPQAEAALLAALGGEREGEVRRAMLLALGFLGGEASLAVLLDEAEARPEATLAGARILLRGWEVHGPDREDRASSVREGGEGERWWKRFAENLTDSDPTERQAASWFFWSAPGDELLLQHRAELEEAVRTLSPGDPAAVQAAEALGRVADAGSLGFWKALAGDSPAEGLRLVAVRTLGRANLVEREGVRALLWERVEEDGSDAVAFEAAMALQGGFRIPAATLSRAADFLGREDGAWPRDVSFLAPVAMLRSPEPVLVWTERRMAAGEGEAAAWGIQALGLLPDPPITVELFRLFDLGGNDPDVTLAVTRALNGRWERIWEGPEVMARYLSFFEARIRDGQVPAAVHAVRALAHPIFVDLDAEARALDALAHRLELGLEARSVIREGWAAFASRRGAPFFQDDWNGAGFIELDAEAVPRAWLPGSGGVGDESVEAASPAAEIPVEALRTLGHRPLLILETTRGTVVSRLVPEEAPRSVAELVRRVTAGELDGTPWHRGVPGRLVQGGDGTAHDGTGRDGVVLPLEHTSLLFGAGAVAVAGGQRDGPEGGMNLFIGILPEFGFDGSYAAVGQVVAGKDVLPALLATDRIQRACVQAFASENGALLALCPE